MSDVTEQALMREYELIEEEKLTEAEVLLKPILDQEPDNADAWWLYAHAVSDPETARLALNQVLKLDGSYEGAQELLVQLDDNYAGPTLETQRTTAVPPTTLPSLPDDDDVDSPDFLADMEEAKEAVARFDDDFSLDDIEEGGPDATPAKRGFPLVPVVIALILIVLVVILLLANPFGTPSSSPTQQVGVASETAALAVTPTPVAATDISTAEVSNSAVAQALSAFELVEGTVTTVDTSLGRTQIAGICTSTSNMRESLGSAMASLATISETVDADVEAIGVTLVDCENGNSILRVIAVPVADALAYSAGDLAEADFQARWVAAA